MIRKPPRDDAQEQRADWSRRTGQVQPMLQGQKDLLEVGRLILFRAGAGRVATAAAFYLLECLRRTAAAQAAGRVRLEARRRRRVPDRRRAVGQCVREKRAFCSRPCGELRRISSGLAAPRRRAYHLARALEGDVKGRESSWLLRPIQPDHQLPRPARGKHRIVITRSRPTCAPRRFCPSRSHSPPSSDNKPGAPGKGQLLAHQNAEVERKNREVEAARQALEEKAAQLRLTSKYKS